VIAEEVTKWVLSFGNKCHFVSILSKSIPTTLRISVAFLSIVLLSTQSVRSTEETDAKNVNELNYELINDTNIEDLPTDEYFQSSISAPTNGSVQNRSVSNAGYSQSQPLYYQQYRTPAYKQNMQSMYGKHTYNYMQPIANQGYNGNHYNQSYMGYGSNSGSPYQNVPGSYSKESYNKELYFSGHRYSAETVYSSYLVSGAYQYYSGRCSNHYGQTPVVTINDMNSAFDYAHHQLKTYGNDYVNSSSYSNQMPPLYLKEKEALLMEYVTQYFAKYKCLSKYQTTTFLPSVNVGGQYMKNNRYGDTSCYSSYGSSQGWKLQCSNAYKHKYRSIDGSCNNLKHPYWGKSYVCHIRLLPPDYADGVSAPRVAYNGKPLPSSRLLSNMVTSDKPFQSFYTHIKMAFGQFVNHDITNTPVHGSYAMSSSYSGPTDCCKNRKQKHCYPIDIPPSPYDYQYRKYNNTCQNFVRSAPCPLCEIGPRQQMNTATSFIDAGTVYGNTVNDSAALRTYRFGLLKTSKDKYGKPILLATPTPWQNECSPPSANMQCFTAGDQRVNQHPSLMCMHLVVLRRHNEHVTALRLVNPHWNDEILFQEGRRLTIAEIQHITYNEYLPILFGNTLMSYYSLSTSPYGYTNYEPYTDPTSWNDYATSACRFGHSQIRGFHTIYGGKGNNGSHGYWLRDSYLDPSHMWSGQMDGLLKGLVSDYSLSVDPYYSVDIKEYLLRKKGERFGGDLIAKNIHRGRDHGLPSYVNYLKFCFGYQVRSWDDIKLFIPEYIVNVLRHIYGSYENIDFYIAGISERHFPDADVGPTFACVLGIQYYHLKFGDRYYYEHGGQSGSFSLAQLDNIRKTTSMARLICRTSDYISSVQRYAFFPVSNYNKETLCKDYPEINYQLWKESPQKSYK
jgi:peroxidase